MKRSETIRPTNIYSGKYTESGVIGRWLLDHFYHTINQLVKNLPVNTVLEVGCGQGYSLTYLKKIFSGKHLEASEYESRLIEDARRINPGIRIIQESVYDLKHADDSFDLVLALEVLEHLKNPEKAFSELRRITKKYCLLSVPREPLWRFLNLARGKYWLSLGNPYSHINHYSKKAIIRLAGQYFKKLEIATPIPWTIILSSK
jgi:SAM-dependent methyltransferase